jgi:hypothetical protein
VAWAFQLKLELDSVPSLARRFKDIALDAPIERDLVPAARAQRYLTKEQFLRLCEWKSARIRPRCASNDELCIEEATRVALTAASERLRIGALTLLDGVAYPVASSILHWVHEDPYPILDRRALWSVGIEAPPSGGLYGFDFWLDYTVYCRGLATQLGLPMRVLDRALWQFAYENQPT